MKPLRTILSATLLLAAIISQAQTTPDSIPAPTDTDVDSIAIAEAITTARVTITPYDAKGYAGPKRVIVPPPLQKGDSIVVLTPASAVSAGKVENAVAALRAMGFKAGMSQYSRGNRGTYCGTQQQRVDDLRRAILNPDVKAIICARGGYGVVQLLSELDKLPLRSNPKWIVGFSDISALHALMFKHGIASVHGPMGVNLAKSTHPSPSCRALMDVLQGSHMRYDIPYSRYNHLGTAEAPLVGGNLAVLTALIGTPYDMIRPGTILFIEDVSEPIYKVQRMLYQLKLSGVLGKLKGIIVGDFTETPSADRNHSSMESMIADMVREYNYPVAFGMPVGHGKVNVPLVESVPVKLEVTDHGTTITQ